MIFFIINFVYVLLNNIFLMIMKIIVVGQLVIYIYTCDPHNSTGLALFLHGIQHKVHSFGVFTPLFGLLHGMVNSLRAVTMLS